MSAGVWVHVSHLFEDVEVVSPPISIYQYTVYFTSLCWLACNFFLMSEIFFSLLYLISSSIFIFVHPDWHSVPSQKTLIRNGQGRTVTTTLPHLVRWVSGCLLLVPRRNTKGVRIVDYYAVLRAGYSWINFYSTVPGKGGISMEVFVT